MKIPLKNCKTGRQGRGNAHQAAQQKSLTDLKWLDISIKRTWKSVIDFADFVRYNKEKSL